MKILVFGAGVIGSFYAARFCECGHEVSLLARGRRLAVLKEKGLITEKGRSKVRITASLEDDDIYDFIFVCVREEQAEEALRAVSANRSRNIVTMINTSRSYEGWEDILGRGRLLPAFPGAGGTIENDVLHARCTPALVQRTAFGEVDGNNSTERIRLLKRLFSSSHIPSYAEKRMHDYQISHLGLVVPLADAYYEASSPERAGWEKSVMRSCALSLRSNLAILRRAGILRPLKLHLITVLPVPLISFILSILYRGDFGRIFMYPHALKASSEMARLHAEFYHYLERLADKE